MKITKENVAKALELLNEQSVFLSEEAFAFLQQFVKAVKKQLQTK